MPNLEWWKIVVTEDRPTCKSQDRMLEVNLSRLKILHINYVLN